MTALADYFLHVELLVKEDDSKEFEERVGEFLEKGSFRRFVKTADLRLWLALRSTQAFAYDPHPEAVVGSIHVEQDPLRGARVYRYVHLWNVLSLEGLDLAPVMTASADDPLYMAIDALVVSETQEFVARMKWPFGNTAKKLDSETFVRVTRHFYNARDLNIYSYDVPVIRPVQEKTGIRNVGYFQAVTGTLETVTEFWQLPSESTQVSAATLESGKFAGATDEQLAIVAEVQKLRHEERHELYSLYQNSQQGA